MSIGATIDDLVSFFNDFTVVVKSCSGTAAFTCTPLKMFYFFGDFSNFYKFVKLKFRLCFQFFQFLSIFVWSGELTEPSTAAISTKMHDSNGLSPEIMFRCVTYSTPYHDPSNFGIFKKFCGLSSAQYAAGGSITGSNPQAIDNETHKMPKIVSHTIFENKYQRATKNTFTLFNLMHKTKRTRFTFCHQNHWIEWVIKWFNAVLMMISGHRKWLNWVSFKWFNMCHCSTYRINWNENTQ